ncbi:MAG: group III truncated hemoglobin [Gemmatimonadaceae bacterium]
MSERESPKRDIRDEDLHETLTAFYAIIAVDPLLLRYFEKVDMAVHMPRIVAFWSTLLFHTRAYSGNAFRPHLEMPGLSGEHFQFWVATLESVVDARFKGPSATLMKELAHRIGYGMQVRLGIQPFELFRPSH